MISDERAQDVKIAEALGWKVFPYVVEHEAANVSGLAYCPPGVPVHIGTVEKVPAYSSDPVAFEALIVEIARRGLGPAYVDRVSDLVFPDGETEPDGETHWPREDVWDMWSAPQSTKAAAALAVLTEGKT